MPETKNYKLAALERALTRLTDTVRRPQDIRQTFLQPTEAMMLLEAARIGAAYLYTHPELVESLRYPFP